MNDEMATLVRLSDTGLTLADPEADVRGMTVVDTNAEDAGRVDDLVIDEAERHVRFLEVGSGGFLGIGKEKRLIPVDAVTGIDDKVHINQDRDRIAAGPGYDPELSPIPDRPDLEDVYGYYGVMPFWGAGYTYPLYPYRRQKP